jgi:hypothetical protein
VVALEITETVVVLVEIGAGEDDVLVLLDVGGACVVVGGCMLHKYERPSIEEQVSEPQASFPPLAHGSGQVMLVKL